MKYEVAGVELEITDEIRSISDSDNRTGSARIILAKTPDQLVAEIEIRDFGPDRTEIRLVTFLSSPPPIYSHLNRNGAMTVQRLDNGDWVALVRALRRGGKSHPTLNYISPEELGSLLGTDWGKWASALGFSLGTWESLNPNAKKFKGSVAVSIPAAQSELLVLPWALTRIVALMKRLGESKVVDL